MKVTPEIRDSCEYVGINLTENRSCTDDDPCSLCWMADHVEENEELYQAMGDV